MGTNENEWENEEVTQDMTLVTLVDVSMYVLFSFLSGSI